MPPKIRPSMTSLRASCVRSNAWLTHPARVVVLEHVWPGTEHEIKFSVSFFVPKKFSAAFITDPVKQPCADGYSWWLGVSARGNQEGSGSVASLPSVSPATIAVTGRQKL